MNIINRKIIMWLFVFCSFFGCRLASLFNGQKFSNEVHDASFSLSETFLLTDEELIGVQIGILAAGILTSIDELYALDKNKEFKKGELEIIQPKLINKTITILKTNMWNVAANQTGKPEIVKEVNEYSQLYEHIATDMEGLDPNSKEYKNKSENLIKVENKVIGSKGSFGLVDLTEHKINLVLLKIELGGGHKSAVDAINKSLRSNGVDERYMQVEVSDFFGPDGKSGKIAGAVFNSQLQAEANLGLKELLANKKKLEKYFLSNLGQERIKLLFEGGKDKLGEDWKGINTLFNNGKKPTLIISAQPFGIAGIEKYVNSQISKGETIMRVIPTDIGMSDWFQYVSKSSKIRYDGSWDHKFIRSQFKAAQIENYYFNGFPVREEIVNYANRLHRSGDAESVLNDATDFIVEASQKYGDEMTDKLIDDSGTKPYLETNPGVKFVPKIDRSILMMMGSQGISSKRYLSYIESLLENPPEISIGEGKIHVFVAAITTNDFMETTNLEEVLSKRADPIKVERRKLINDGFKNLKNNPRLHHDKVVFHMMPFINASQVAKFLATSPTITKAGGATAAEIATIGMHPAIFNMKITHIAPWEKANADVLSKNGLAIPLPYSDSDETKEFKGLKSAVEKAYTLRPQPLDDRGFGSDFFTSYQNEVFSDYNKTVLTNKGVPGLPSIKVMQNNSIKPPRFFKWRIR